MNDHLLLMFSPRSDLKKSPVWFGRLVRTLGRQVALEAIASCGYSCVAAIKARYRELAILRLTVL